MAQRDFSASMLSEIQASRLRPVLFYEGEFVSGSPEVAQFLRLWTGVGPVEWNGSTWTGAGHLLAISEVSERNSVEAIGFSVTLSGMPSANIALALLAIRQGKPGKLWLGCLNDNGSIIADPYLLQEGKFDIMVIEDDGEHCTIRAQYESRLITLLRPRVRRYTSEDQQIDYPGDLGFEYVPSLQDKELLWGGAGAASSPVAQPTTIGAAVGLPGAGTPPPGNFGGD